MTTKPWNVTGVNVRGQTAYLIEPAPESLEEVQAMRRLVEAAPDLLEAASAALIYVMALEQDSALERRLRKALAKAQPKATP